MLIDLFRKVLPIKVRQDLGLWLISQSARSKWLLYPYYQLLCGETPKNLTLLPHNESVVTYNNHKVYSPRDGILAFMEVFQDEVYEQLWKPKPRDTVVDIGAYVGMFTVKASDMVGKEGVVYAVEPEPRNLTYLEKNTKGLSNVKIVRAIVGSCNGVGRLFISNASPCHTVAYHHKNSIEIKMVTLDSLRVQPDFVKIDAEGAELEILKGSERVIKKGTRFAIACYHDLPGGGKELGPVVQFLKNRNYKVVVIKKYVFAEPEIHDCSNCRFSKEVAPYKVVLQCILDNCYYDQPHTCDKWKNALFLSEEKEKDNA